MKARKVENLKTDLQAFVEDVAAGIERSERKFWCSRYLLQISEMFLNGNRWGGRQPVHRDYAAALSTPRALQNGQPAAPRPSAR
jgi:hypothetical protein